MAPQPTHLSACFWISSSILATLTVMRILEMLLSLPPYSFVSFVVKYESPDPAAELVMHSAHYVSAMRRRHGKTDAQLACPLGDGNHAYALPSHGGECFAQN